MTEPAEIPAGVVVPISALTAQAKAQLRLLLAAVAGALVLRGFLPAWLVNDQTVDLAAGVVIYGAIVTWSWIRTRWNHRKWLAVARDPNVPPAVVTVKGEQA